MNNGWSKTRSGNPFSFSDDDLLFLRLGLLVTRSERNVDIPDSFQPVRGLFQVSHDFWLGLSPDCPWLNNLIPWLRSRRRLGRYGDFVFEKINDLRLIARTIGCPTWAPVQPFSRFAVTVRVDDRVSLGNTHRTLGSSNLPWI